MSIPLSGRYAAEQPNSLNERLLVQEPYAIIPPTLAEVFGVMDAAILQLIHFWASYAMPANDGSQWVKWHPAKFRDRLPWIGEDLVPSINALIERGYLQCWSSDDSDDKFLRVEKAKVELCIASWHILEAEMEQEERASVRGVVYLMRASFGHYKIGMSFKKTPESRRRALQESTGFKLKTICYADCSDPRQAERRMHNRFYQYRRSGEWFEIPDDLIDEVACAIRGLADG